MIKQNLRERVEEDDKIKQNIDFLFFLTLIFNSPRILNYIYQRKRNDEMKKCKNK